MTPKAGSNSDLGVSDSISEFDSESLSESVGLGVSLKHAPGAGPPGPGPSAAPSRPGGSRARLLADNFSF